MVKQRQHVDRSRAPIPPRVSSWSMDSHGTEAARMCIHIHSAMQHLSLCLETRAGADIWPQRLCTTARVLLLHELDVNPKPSALDAVDVALAQAGWRIDSSRQPDVVFQNSQGGLCKMKGRHFRVRVSRRHMAWRRVYPRWYMLPRNCARQKACLSRDGGASGEAVPRNSISSLAISSLPMP